MSKQPWSAFASVKSTSFVRNLVTDAISVAPEQLMDMEEYRREERMQACGGHDPIIIRLAYAQNELIYDAMGQLSALTHYAEYENYPRTRKVNIFGPAYRIDAGFYLNKPLADIVVGAAIHLYQSQGWTTVLYDGLRTVEGAFNLYTFATPTDIQSGLLALPGQSAHNKGLAVDSMVEDKDGFEIDMGGHFDHLDMESNNRTYDGPKISAKAKKNRLIREAAFLRGAFTQGLIVAPLRPEFWDDRLPENREDLWRVLDSTARCMGITLLSPEDIELRFKDRAAFSTKWESWSYADFLKKWDELFAGQEAKLMELFGVTKPPAEEKIEFYHGNYHPIYDRDLVTSGKNLTRPKAA